MKIQEVITRAMLGHIKWYQAAEIIGVSDRQMRRWKERYERYGYDGLLDRRRNEPSPRRLPMKVATKVLQLYRGGYFDFNVRHFHEELLTEHRIKVSYGWTKALLQTAGLVKKAKKRGQYRRRRERRPLPGMLVHLDGSPHEWFKTEQGERQTLLAFLDDATSECLGAQFVTGEGTVPILTLLKELIEGRGTFVSLYTDRAGHFVYTPKAGGPPDRSHKTQIERVLDDLGIELICAHSPEARGRGERAWRTMQGRLPQELRRAGATTYEKANAYLRDVFIPKYNRLFSRPPAAEGTAFLPATGANLDHIVSLRYERTVGKDNIVQFRNHVYQLPKVQGIATLAGRKVQVRVLLCGTITILMGRRIVASFASEPPTGEWEEAA